jgi:phytoene desaturase
VTRCDVRKKVVIIGAGPGGLTAGMILQKQGYDVEVFEKQPYVGGRNSALKLGAFTFDLGPTFLMMLYVLEDVFQMAGRRLENELELKRIDPLYRLVYGDGRTFFPTHDRVKMRQQIEQLFPGNADGYERFMAYQKKKLAAVVPCLEIPYSSPFHLLRMRLVKALPYLDAHKSLMSHLGEFYTHDDLKVAFTFQAKYLGMSPWNCPATFSIISYLEHGGGIFHPVGGLHKISETMARIIDENGGSVHIGEGVREVMTENGVARGVVLESGCTVTSDFVIVNADFGHAAGTLFGGRLRKWTPERLEKKAYSCSTYMLYLGLDKRYDIPHHSIVFADDYRKNITEIADRMILSEDPSFYVQNACITDPTLAPPGMSTIYVLVPVPNNRSGIDWEKESPQFKERVLRLMETRGGMPGIRKHIKEEKVVTPAQWEEEKYVYRGATFNMGHQVSQMLFLRPHNEFEEVRNCYLVGGGTHPGSGLPTIYQSGRIAADLILQRDGMRLPEIDPSSRRNI